MIKAVKDCPSQLQRAKSESQQHINRAIMEHRVSTQCTEFISVLKTAMGLLTISSFILTEESNLRVQPAGGDGGWWGYASPSTSLLTLIKILFSK